MKNLSLLFLALCAFAIFGCKTAESEAPEAPAAETPAVEAEVQQPAAPETPAAPAGQTIQKNADGTYTLQMTEVK
ncbi:hypothetical protein J6T93_03600 [bacterium]|nr:hypothetical protein [bacterium]